MYLLTYTQRSAGMVCRYGKTTNEPSSAHLHLFVTKIAFFFWLVLVTFKRLVTDTCLKCGPETMIL